MSQSIWGTINPNVTSGTMLATLLNAFKNAFVSGFSGTSRPPNLQAGGFWVDTTNFASPTYYYSFKVYTGTEDVEFFRVNINSAVGGGTIADSTFSVTRISADTTAAILNLIKQRLTDLGQVDTGDLVAEIQFIGRTATSTDPIVANMKWTASEDETATEFGGYLSLYSTPDASNTITEHIRLVESQVEFKTPLSLNSVRLVGQNVATAATIVQLDATKVLVELTGATATDIQGIDSDDESQEIVIHNRSSATVTLKHQNLTAAAADRMKLPGSVDVSIIAEGSATLYYCSTDTRWKLKGTSHRILGKNLKQFRGIITDWTCPVGVTQILLTPYKRRQTMPPGHSSCIDVYGNAYAWGSNLGGGVSDGTQVGKSSPVLMIGGISFARFGDGNGRLNQSTYDSAFGISTTGLLYAWGNNVGGQLGIGDVALRSSPVAVLGGKKWAHVFDVGTWAMGTTMDAQSYSWGRTCMGTIATTATVVSSPVAIIGGYTFEQFSHVYPLANGEAAGGLDSTGTIYTWGGGANGSFIKGGAGNPSWVQLQLSSPIAVVGGYTFKKFLMGNAALGIWGAGLTKDGTLYAWGENSFGQLGVGDRTARSSPVAVLGGLTFMDAYVTNWSGTNALNINSVVALTEDGTAYAWGANVDGNLGVGDVTGRSSPVAVLGGLKFRDLLVTPGNGNGATVLGITPDGTMYGWGSNGFGQLGLGDVASRSSPVAVLGSIKWSHFVVSGLRASGGVTTAVAADGTLYSWGFGAAEAGFGDTTARSSPVAVVGGIGMDNRSLQNVVAIPVTPGTVYRIFLPNGRPSRFGNVPIGIDIERVSIEYDKQGE